MIAVGNIDQLIDAFTASVWLFHGLAISALFIMRLTHQDVPRKFEVGLGGGGGGTRLNKTFGITCCVNFKHIDAKCTHA